MMGKRSSADQQPEQKTVKAGPERRGIGERQEGPLPEPPSSHSSFAQGLQNLKGPCGSPEGVSDRGAFSPVIQL